MDNSLTTEEPTEQWGKDDIKKKCCWLIGYLYRKNKPQFHPHITHKNQFYYL